MFSLSFTTVAAALVVYRFLLLSVPVFSDAVRTHPFVNFACGFCSDIFLAAGLYLLWALLDLIQSPKWRPVVRTLQTVFTVTLVAYLACHLRYVEHFGMTLRPFHLKGLGTGEVWGAGVGMILESWRCVTLLTVTPILGVVFYRLSPRWGGEWSLQRRLMIGLMVIAVSNAVVIRLRHHDDLHTELRYNALTAAYFNNRDYAQILALPRPSPEALKTLRQLLHGPRRYEDIDPEIPLWQSAVPLPVAANPEHQAVRQNLIDTIKASAEPWNVVVVISESLRAKELHAFGNDEPFFAGLTPQIDRIAGDGVRFTETISVGLRTHYGQTAAMCSLFGADDFSILNSAPMSNAVCLPDVFASRGYETSFFYPADNSFDHQNIFYQFHHVKHVYGEQHLPQDAAKGGWGYSDHALFDFANQQLKGSKKPFFSVVLTLTNHAPHQVPADAPSGLIDPSWQIRDQVISYVDWALGDFYAKLQQNFPRTIFVVIADHGRAWDEPPPPNPMDGSYVRHVSRIPWLIVVPGAGDVARGAKIETLASNVDLPPTLLNLLGWSKTPQQFMGEDAFSRTGPVYLDWNMTLLELRQPRPQTLKVKQLGQDVENVLGAVGRFNLIAPPRKEQHLPAK